jgi:hypothetical protein
MQQPRFQTGYYLQSHSGWQRKSLLSKLDGKVTEARRGMLPRRNVLRCYIMLEFKRLGQVE